MKKTPNNDLSPELLRILKIFIVASLAFVLLLSFFNERRADNSGEDNAFRVTDASRLYFRNIRRAYYQVESRSDARLDVYRLSKRVKDSTQNVLNLAIVLNRDRNTAYLYVEPQGRLAGEDPLEIRWRFPERKESGTIHFSFGDRYSHVVFAKELFFRLEENAVYEARFDNKWIPVLQNETERKAFMTTIRDYLRLVQG